jgi:hypothetical protein
LVLGRVDLAIYLALDRRSEGGRVGDEKARRGRVVLGLADQVGGDQRRVRGRVREDRDLGRSGLGVDADDSAHEALGRDAVDVGRAGHHVDRLAAAVGAFGVAVAVGEHRDRSGAPGGVHLANAEQGAGGEHRRVRQPAVLALRRTGQGDGLDAGDAGGHDVHHDRRDERRLRGRHVETDPSDGHMRLHDDRAGRLLRGRLARVRQLGDAGGFEPVP